MESIWLAHHIWVNLLLCLCRPGDSDKGGASFRKDHYFHLLQQAVFSPEIPFLLQKCQRLVHLMLLPVSYSQAKEYCRYTWFCYQSLPEHRLIQLSITCQRMPPSNPCPASTIKSSFLPLASPTNFQDMACFLWPIFIYFPILIYYWQKFVSIAQVIYFSIS